MVIPPNIWQDNMLTGSTPFSISPRRSILLERAACVWVHDRPINVADCLRSDGNDILAKGAKNIPANTPMDVDRYEKDWQRDFLGRGEFSEPLRDRCQVWQRHPLHLDAGPRAQNRQPDCGPGYVGTVAQKLPRITFPNAYPGATPEFAPYTPIQLCRRRTGGFGVMNVMTNDCALQLQRAAGFAIRTVGHGGPAFRPRTHGVSRSTLLR